MATITVNGYGEVLVPPDEATATLGVECVAATPREAMSEVAEQARALVGLLDALEIPPAKRSTTGVLVSEAGEHDPQGRWQHRGFRAVESLTVAAGAEVLGELIGGAVDRARARVNGPHWRVAADNPARREALQAAAENARARAEAVAAGLGVRLGAIVEAKEEAAFHPMPRQASFAPLTMEGGPPIEAGEATIAGNVSVTFQVEPA
jgi:uncharacterized protein YggE